VLKVLVPEVLHHRLALADRRGCGRGCARWFRNAEAFSRSTTPAFRSRNKAPSPSGSKPQRLTELPPRPGTL